MPYHNFTLKNVESRLGIVVEKGGNLYQHFPPNPPSQQLIDSFSDAEHFFTDSEMARREFYIFPILKEVIRQVNYRAIIYSQIEFAVDPLLQLTGEVDYLIAPPPIRYSVQKPVIGIAEAKVSNIPSGLGKCIAEMVASRIHNERVHGLHLPQIYGVVTDGLDWQFLELVNQTVRIDAFAYPLRGNLDHILGILLGMIETQLKHIEEATAKTN